MNPLSIFARAMPYGIPNTYNEVLMAGCLKGRMPSKLPMYIMHNDDEEPCGKWQHFTDLQEGLFVQGLITNQYAIQRVLDGELTELSITFADVGDTSILGILRGSRGLRAMEAKERLQRRGVMKYPDNQTVWENMPRMTVWAAELSEISLVDKGSFPGTKFHIVGETEAQLNRRLSRAKR